MKRKIKLSQLFTSDDFKVRSVKDQYIITCNKPLNNRMILDKQELDTGEPVKYMIIILNHILQSTELKMVNEYNEEIKSVNLNGSSLEDIYLEYELM